LTRAPGRRDQFNGPKLGHDCNRVATYVTASTAAAAAAASTTCSNISGAHVSLARRAIGGAMAFYFIYFLHNNLHCRCSPPPLLATGHEPP